jgi:hypothetical protein
MEIKRRKMGLKTRIRTSQGTDALKKKIKFSPLKGFQPLIGFTLSLPLFKVAILIY